MFALFLTSCESELDKDPITEKTESQAFESPESYEQFLAKIYGGWAVNGQDSGDADIQGIDGNFSNYVRLLFTLQQLSTEESIIAWNDGTIHDIHNHVWTPSNEFIGAMYYRVYFQIGMVNQFLRETTDTKLDGRGVDADLKAEIQLFRAEARFMRAMSYWHGIDFFGDIPFVTEDDIVGNFFPEQKSRTEVFNFIEAELLAIESTLIGARQNEAGRADQGAVWMLLAKLYLNAEVYTGSARYNDAMTYVNKVISGGYTIHNNSDKSFSSYSQLFLADNGSNGAENETIFSILFDGINITGYGGTTYLTHASIGGDMDANDFGVSSGWGGIRTTKVFVEKFDDITGNTDSRALFFTEGQTLEIENPFTFTDGYAVAKYRNIVSTADKNNIGGDYVDGGSDKSGEYVDIDFPVFRLADAYLMYAELTLRGGGGDAATAVDYINMLRERAYGDTSGNISSGDLDLDFVLDERSRELFWESHRRTDLIRFGQFSDQGVWPWKGGVMAGTTTERYRDLYPIPSADIIANPTLNQNNGY